MPNHLLPLLQPVEAKALPPKQLRLLLSSKSVFCSSSPLNSHSLAQGLHILRGNNMRGRTVDMEGKLDMINGRPSHNRSVYFFHLDIVMFLIS